MAVANRSKASPPLFRAQALQQRHHLGLAEPMWTVPRLNVWAAIVVALVIVASLIISQLEYADKVHAQGWVVPAAPPVAVISPVHGLVKRLYVQADQYVRKGQRLVEIETQAQNLSGSTAGALQAKRLQAKAQSVRQQMRLEQATWQHQQVGLQSRLQALQKEATSLQLQSALLQQQYELAQNEEQGVKTLAGRGFVSRRDASQFARARLQSQRDLLVQQQRQQQNRASQVAAATELKLLAAQIVAAEAQYTAQLNDLEEQRRQAVASQGVELIAPQSGQLVNLSVRSGEPVADGQAVLSVLPRSGQKHRIEAMFNAVSAARINPGMPVRLRYMGFPSQRYGSGQGRIVRVSQVAQGAPHNPLFKVEIEVLQLPKRMHSAAAGMTVNIDVVLANAVLSQRLVEPLRELWSRL